MTVHLVRPPTEEAQLGITPLVDVVLLLLIFFLVTTSFSEPHLALDLAEADAASETPLEDVLRVSITKEGDVLLDGDARGLQALEARLAEDPPAGGVEVRADRAAAHGSVVDVLDAAQEHGVDEIAIAVETPVGD